MIRTTLEHPFRPVEGGWTPAGELELGQLLVTLQGAGVPVESLRATGEMATVYNLEVEDHHTYFVSGDDWGFAVWAHNAKYAPSAEHMAEAVALGKEGELAAGITGRKRGVVGPLSDKMRFADEHTATLLKESKNVARQGWTAQLKDYAAIAKKEGISFELWVRESTKLS